MAHEIDQTCLRTDGVLPHSCWETEAVIHPGWSPQRPSAGKPILSAARLILLSFLPSSFPADWNQFHLLKPVEALLSSRGPLWTPELQIVSRDTHFFEHA